MIFDYAWERARLARSLDADIERPNGKSIITDRMIRRVDGDSRRRERAALSLSLSLTTVKRS